MIGRILKPRNFALIIRALFKIAVTANQISPSTFCNPLNRKEINSCCDLVTPVRPEGWRRSVFLVAVASEQLLQVVALVDAFKKMISTKIKVNNSSSPSNGKFSRTNFFQVLHDVTWQFLELKYKYFQMLHNSIEFRRLETSAWHSTVSDKAFRHIHCSNIMAKVPMVWQPWQHLREFSAENLREIREKKETKSLSV